MMVQMYGVGRQFGRRAALRGLNLSVPEGSTFALIGANGAGKTTAIRVLMNILSPSTGRVEVLGVDSRKLSQLELAQIGYVSENQILPPRMTVAGYLNYLRPLYPSWDRQLEASLLGRLRLPREPRIAALSHGMRMKMALTCALSFRPKLLVLDEPFSGLDPLVRDEFMEHLISQAGDMTILISSHELADIENLATHVGFIDKGRLLFEESMGDLSARLREVRVTLSREASAPTTPPPEWLNVRAIGNVLTFVETHYCDEASSRRIQSLLIGVRNIDAQPVGLRAIFTTLIRAIQEEGATHASHE